MPAVELATVVQSSCLLAFTWGTEAVLAMSQQGDEFMASLSKSSAAVTAELLRLTQGSPGRPFSLVGIAMTTDTTSEQRQVQEMFEYLQMFLSVMRFGTAAQNKRVDVLFDGTADRGATMHLHLGKIAGGVVEIVTANEHNIVNVALANFLVVGPKELPRISLEAVSSVGSAHVAGYTLVSDVAVKYSPECSETLTARAAFCTGRPLRVTFMTGSKYCMFDGYSVTYCKRLDTLEELHLSGA
jgi:hypothetical protein